MKLPFSQIKVGHPDKDGYVSFSLAKAAKVFEAVARGDSPAPLASTMSSNSFEVGYHFGVIEAGGVDEVHVSQLSEYGDYWDSKDVRKLLSQGYRPVRSKPKPKTHNCWGPSWAKWGQELRRNMVDLRNRIGKLS